MAESFSIQAILSAIDSGFTKTIEGAKRALDGLGKGATSIKNLSGSMDQAGSVFKQTLGAMGVYKVISSSIDTISDSVGGAIKRIDTLNNSNRTFANMGFSAQQTKGMMDNLQASIKGLPTGLDDAVKGVQIFAATTGDISKGQQVWSAMNDAIIGFGGSTADVNNETIQLSQAFADGKIDAQTWNSMMQNGLGPTLNAIAKQMGITTGQLKDGLSNGKISVGQFQDALVNLDKNGGGGLKSLHQIAMDSTAGIGTSFTNMKTAIIRGIANVIKSIDDFLQKVTGLSISDIITNVGKNFENTMNGIADALHKVEPVAQQVSSTFQGMKSGLSGDIFRSIGAGVLAAAGALFTFNTTIKIASAVMTAFNAIASINPFMLLALAIVGVVAALTYFFTQTERGKALWQGFMSFLTKTWNTISQTASEVWSNVCSAVMNAATTVQGYWNGFTEFMGQLWNTVVSVATTAWNNFVTSVSPVIEAIKNLWNSFVQFFTAVWNTISPIVSAVWNTISTMIQTSFTTIVSIISGGLSIISSAWSAIWNVLVAVATAIWNVIVTVVQVALTMLGTIIQAGMSIISTIWNTVWNVLVTVATTIWNVIVTVVATVINLLATIIQAATAVIQGNWMGVWTAIQTFVVTLWNGILSVATSIFNGIMTVISTVLNGIMSISSTVWSAVVSIVQTCLSGAYNIISTMLTSVFNIVKSIWSGIISFVGSVLSALGSIISSAWNGFLQIITSIGNGIKSIVISTWNNVLSFITGVVSRVYSAVSSGFGRVVSAVSNGMSKAINAVTSVAGHLVSAGRDFVMGFVKGITGAIGSAINAAANMAKKALNAAKSALGIHSPSRVMKNEVGYYVAKGLALGISQNTGLVEKASNALAKSAIVDSGEFRSSFDGLRNLTNQAINGSVSTSLNSDVTVNQPAYINLNLGGRNFTAFVDNISKEQGSRAELERQYSF